MDYFFEGAGHWPITLTHQFLVIMMILYLPFGKLFHVIERPASLGVELYYAVGPESGMKTCARCGRPFGMELHIADVKTALKDVGYTFWLPQEGHHWQDYCPRCKRVSLHGCQRARLGEPRRPATAPLQPTPPGEARVDWEIICDLAQRLGAGDQFAYHSAGEIWDELRRASPGGKADYYGITYEKAELPDADYPFFYTTGRVIFHYLSGNQTRRLGALVENAPEPYVEIHPLAAEKLGVDSGDLLRVRSLRADTTPSANYAS